MRLLTDEDVGALLDRRAVIEVMRDAIRRAALGRLLAPPRRAAELGDHRLVFTAGGDEEAIGFRAYGRPGMHEEIVGVWDRVSGHLETTIVGQLLGPLRTGSIGGVAVDVLARPDARSVVVIGSGKQARAQLAAVSQVRELTQVFVTSPTAAHRDAYATWAREELGLDVEPTDDVRAAVEGCDIVLCATKAEGPVIEADWVTPGTHVTTIGPREVSRSEIPVELAVAADHIATDAPAQLEAVGQDHFLHGHEAWRRIEHLGDLIGADDFHREDDDVTVFLSLGLAGTEVALARWFAHHAHAT